MLATMSTRIIAGVVAIAGGLALSGCASTHYAWDLEEDDIVGSWGNRGPVGTELTISADGTFHTTSWPSNLNCQGPIAKDTEALETSPTKDLTGTWSLYGGDGDNTQGGSLASLTLSVEEACDPDGQAPMAYFTTSDEGVVSMCFPLDEDPDRFTPSRALGLLEAASGGLPDEEVCESR